MECPACGSRLVAAFILETEDDDRPVRRDHQWWRCGGCGACYFAVLVEDKTNLFNDDLEHTGVLVEPERWRRDLQRAAGCRRPRDRRCDCAVHRDPPRSSGTPAWYTC